jgi:hypothetical protein
MLTLYTTSNTDTDELISGLVNDSGNTKYLDLDWNGQRCPTPIAYAIMLSPESLIIFAKRNKPARIHKSAESGCYRAGLWHHDVFELFLSIEGDTAYQEFNLAPNGSWWTSVFHSPRRINEDYAAPQSIRTKAEVRKGSWWALMEFPTTALGISLDKGVLIAHAASITDNTPRRYCSSSLANLSPSDLPKQPDFHRASLLQPIERKVL